MIRSGIAHRYAKALFQAALQAGVADEVSGDLQGFLRLMSEMPQIRNFILSPQVSTEDKHALITKAFGGRAHELFVDFLRLLIDKKRIVAATDIAEAYSEIYQRHKGMIAVKAITAVPLKDQERQKLLRTLERKSNKTIRLTQAVDPDIIGGMILVMEDKVIDGSVRHELEQLRRRLRETRVIQAGGTSTGEGR
jgi:F-type H+-transporting ATPase subunit delta